MSALEKLARLLAAVFVVFGWIIAFSFISCLIAGHESTLVVAAGFLGLYIGMMHALSILDPIMKP